MFENKSINVVLIVVVMALAVFVGTQIGSSESTTSKVTETIKSGLLTFEQTSWGFGEISMRDGDAVKEIHVSNTSDAPVTIESMETSCMCTTAQVVHSDGTKSSIKGMVGHGGTPSMREIIQPGETVSVFVTFDPNAHGPNATGFISRTVSLKTDAENNSDVQLKFTANVVK